MSAFLRDYELDIYTQSGRKLEVRELDINFQLQRKKDKKKQTGQIVILGMSQDTQAVIAKDDYVILKAGYKENLKQVFSGKVKSIKKNKTSLTLKFEEGKDIEKNRISKSYPKNVNAKKILEDCLKNTELEKDFSLKNLPKKIFKNGFSINDTTDEVIKKIEDNTNTDICVGNGVVNMTKRDFEDSDIQQDIAVVLNHDSGLIEVNKDEDERIKFKCLLLPEININNYVKIYLKSSLYSLFAGVIGDGYIYAKIEDISYRGDSQQGEWIIEAIAAKSKIIETEKAEVIGG